MLIDSLFMDCLFSEIWTLEVFNIETFFHYMTPLYLIFSLNINIMANPFYVS